VHDDNAGLKAAKRVELSRGLHGSRAIRLLATTNLSVYATLMERHVSDGAVPETELVVRLERDLADLDDAQSGLALIKAWASQGWLHRIVDERHGQNVCYLTQDARRALDFLRGMRRQDTIATGGSITGIDVDFSSLPQVDQQARPPHQRRPRFDGDVSELPDRACWALQHLLTRRYLSAEADADVYSWVLEYRKELSVRLSELDLLLRIVDGTDVTFIEQARYESARGIKLLRREPLGTYDSILALHLAQMMRASGGQTVLISREEMHGLFSGVLNDTDRDAVTFAARIDGAIARLTGLEILRKSRDDEDSYTISPVITAIMTASVITKLQQQFEQLLNGDAPQDEND